MFKKIRSQQIVIDLPTEDATIWVQATLQRCMKGGVDNKETLQTIDRVGFVNRSFNDFVTQMTTITDPVTGLTITVSGAGVAMLIRDMVCHWIMADRGGVLNENGDIIED